MKFKKRLVCPTKENKYYNSNLNPFVAAGYGMFQNNGNCTCYAWGRMSELIEGKCKLYTGNAETWYKHTEDGYSRGKIPKLGAVICWEGKGNLAGHVAVVEEINSDGSIVTSNSGWKKSLFYTQKISKPYNLGSNYIFQGFIYNPNKYDGEVKPSGNKRIKEIQEYLNNRYNSGLTVDGYYGTKTHEALVKALQKEFNIQFNAGLVVDGKFGPLTKKACPIVCYGSRGNIVSLIQAMLYCKNYDPNGFDACFGNGMLNCVKLFQKNNNLTIDGKVGPQTFEKLFK